MSPYAEADFLSVVGGNVNLSGQATLGTYAGPQIFFLCGHGEFDVDFDTERSTLTPAKGEICAWVDHSARALELGIFYRDANPLVSPTLGPTPVLVLGAVASASSCALLETLAGLLRRNSADCSMGLDMSGECA